LEPVLLVPLSLAFWGGVLVFPLPCAPFGFSLEAPELGLSSEFIFSSFIFGFI
jgi:hypothetical protein